MKITTLLDDYILNLDKNFKNDNLNISVFPSFLVYFLSIFSVSISYGIIYELDIISWFSLVISNFIFSIIIIFLFSMWTSFISAIFKKNNSIDKFLSLIFSSHSTYFLLLPLSFVFYYFKFTYFFSFFQFFVILLIIKRILKYTKNYFKFNNLHMFFIVGLPCLFIMVLMFLPIIFVVFYFYSKI
ncbi:MAG: hypothetical protein N2505_01975 [Endomicrobia bacterium]|nr:hypothetical protein [Endomicrobiia bacterium]